MLDRKIVLFIGATALSVASSFAQVNPPTALLPVPSEHQVKWQQMETYAFIHFGLNTFANREWGFGDTPASVFNPSALDCEQWVRTLKNAGMKGVILTAKHHDGFCLWPTKYNEYNIKNSPYKNGKGDVVGELAAACRKYGLKFAVYLSPWDRNAANYGSPAYVDYFYNQLEELLTQYGDVFEVWFDGANGGDGWYGGANEKREIDHKTYYQFERAYALIDKYQPQAIIFSDSGPGCRWVGNEKGFAGETNWALLRKGEISAGMDKRNELQRGHINGNQWTAAECDVSIRKGWFFHEDEDNTVKSPEQLVDLYYKSVGRNATLLLNFPVDKRGLIPSQDSLNAVRFHEYIQEDFAKNLLQQARISSSQTREGFATKNLTDGSFETYWAAVDGTKSATIVCKWKRPQTFNRVMLQENIRLGQRVKSFKLYAKSGKAWKEIPVGEETTTIGYKRLLRFAALTTSELKIEILDAKAPVCLSEIGVYKAKERVFVNPVQKINTLAYHIEGAERTAVSQLTDYDANTTFTKKGREMTLVLDKVTPVNTFYYVPLQSTVKGLIHTYEIWAGTDKAHLTKVAEGEFSNIKNNPVSQKISFPTTEAKYVVLKAKAMIDEADDFVNACEIYLQ